MVSNNQKLDFYVKPLSDEAAFNKGVEYFVEVVFFYGVLIGIALFEVNRSHQSSEKTKKELADLRKMCIESEQLNGKL